MIKFEKKETKKWNFQKDNNEIIELNLISSTVTNKYNIITDYIENISKNIEGFEDWLFNFLVTYENSGELRYSYMESNVPEIKKFVDLYVSFSNIDYSKFVDLSKTKKNSILFTPQEIQDIITLSGYLKIYSLISNNFDFKLDHSSHRKIYNLLSYEILHNNELAGKILSIIKTKTYTYNISNKSMWFFLKNIHAKSIDVHVLEIFNFVMNSIFILCEDDKNPIVYFLSVVSESVQWFLRSVYKNLIIYDDSISTEDIQTGQSTNNLKTYCYNDTLGRLKGISYEYIWNKIEKEKSVKFIENDKDIDIITEFQNRISQVIYISPLSECLTYPLLSKITNIPYEHLRTLSPEHSAILSSYLYSITREVFKDQYNAMFGLLDYYPTEAPSITTTYRIKDKSIHNFLKIQNEVKDFFTFNTKILPNKIISHFIGKISRVSFHNIFDGSRLNGIPLSKVESNMIQFYTLFFANKFESEIKEMVKIVNSSF